MAAFVGRFVAVGLAAGRALPRRSRGWRRVGRRVHAVVLGQTANAFACRSTTRWPGALGWTTNRLLIPGVAVGVVFAFVTIFWESAADTLDQANPPLVGWAVALATAGAVLAVDAWDKHTRHAARVNAAARRSPA